MKVSILCAVRNEAGTINEHLASLVGQTYKPHEIIIIDDESDDGTSEICQKYAKEHGFVKYVRIKHNPRGSHTEPRLFGMKLVQGDIVFVVDADAYYDTNYLFLAVQHLKKEGVGGVIGKMRMWSPKTIVSKYRDAWYTYRFDNHDLINKQIKAGKIAAWVFKKKVYDLVGGYDPRDNYGEDVDLAKRIQAAGHEVIYEPDALWYHKWEDTLIRLIKKHFQVGKFNVFHNKNNIFAISKVLYFGLFFPLLGSALFSQIALYLLGLHILPLVLLGLHRLYICRKSPNAHYMLLYPLISYLINIPYSYGFLSVLIGGRPKQKLV